MDLFKTDDFNRKIPLEFFGNGPKSFGFCWTSIAETCSAIANAKFNEWLKQGSEVYGWPIYPEKGANKLWSAELSAYDDKATHKAILVCIEEIKKPCEHAILWTSNNTIIPECRRCGVKLKPTGWTEVE